MVKRLVEQLVVGDSSGGKPLTSARRNCLPLVNLAAELSAPRGSGISTTGEGLACPSPIDIAPCNLCTFEKY